jgi:hypothetical protein
MARVMIVLALCGSTAFAEKRFTKGTGETWDCAKDPVVTIKTAKGTYGFLGECKRVTIAAGKNAVSISSVGKLLVAGSDNVIDVEQVDAVTVTGARNQVTWKKAINGDKPKISAGAKSNHVTQTK